MDIEFHYYMTYLVAAKSGFGPGDAFTIAYSSQYVDDNDMIFEIDKGKESAYRNYISQTLNILKPKGKLFRIYPLFHFIPGEPMSQTAWRKDGKMHWLNTTPNSENANLIFDKALASENLYRIGIAAHGYADTWAHQNFVGYFDGFNAVASPLGTAAPRIGHAGAGHDPDRPGLVWQDTRLLNEAVDNKKLFLEAAEQMLRKLVRYVDPTVSEKGVGEKAAELRKDLDWAMGERDQTNRYRNDRISRYRNLAARTGYGELPLPKYNPNLWFSEAISESVRGLRNRSSFALARLDPLTDVYSWKNKEDYHNTSWYRFQQAVKDHQNEAWEVLSGANMLGLELPEF